MIVVFFFLFLFYTENDHNLLQYCIYSDEYLHEQHHFYVNRTREREKSERENETFEALNIYYRQMTLHSLMIARNQRRIMK